MYLLHIRFKGFSVVFLRYCIVVAFYFLTAMYRFLEQCNFFTLSKIARQIKPSKWTATTFETFKNYYEHAIRIYLLSAHPDKNGGISESNLQSELVARKLFKEAHTAHKQRTKAKYHQIKRAILSSPTCRRILLENVLISARKLRSEFTKYYRPNHHIMDDELFAIYSTISIPPRLDWWKRAKADFIILENQLETCNYYHKSSKLEQILQLVVARNLNDLYLSYAYAKKLYIEAIL